MHGRGRSRHEVSSIGMLVLSTLKDEPLTGMKIINKLSNDFQETSFTPKSGTIYPILDRLEKKMYIEQDSSVDPSESREKFYRLTHRGKQLLAETLDKGLKRQMAFSSRFFEYISGFSKNLLKFSEDFTSQFESDTRKFRISSLIGEIANLKNLKLFYEDQLAKLVGKIEQKQLLLEKLQKGEIASEEDEESYHKIPINEKGGE